MQKVYDSITNMDCGLFELHALLNTLHTALDGRDELQPDQIQGVVNVCLGKLSELTEDFQTVMHSVLTGQDPEEDQTGAPLLYTDPETGQQRIFQDPEI